MFTRRQVLGYLFMPQVAPRLHGLMGTGFGHLAYFMAQIYRAANLIPAHHPCLRSNSIGRYSVRQIMAVASSNLKFTRTHIDQVIVFFAILAGIFMLCAQFFIMLASFLINPAFAQASLPEDYGSFFTISEDAAKEDIAFRLLDRVFGVPDLFGSREDTELIFHTALHGLFQIYSTGLLIIAVLIVIYFITAVLAETAQTGTPFGKRFNHVWAPIRLVVGVGALIPIAYGLNSAQWVTLYAAKFGSSFASNGWNKYHTTLEKEFLGDRADLVGEPQLPDMEYLASFMMLVKTCKIAEEDKRGIGTRVDPGKGGIQAYLVKNPGEDQTQGQRVESVDWEGALEFFNNGDIRIRFGSRNQEEYTRQKGYVFPYCGEIIFQTAGIHEPGTKVIQKAYYDLVVALWKTDQYQGYPRRYVYAFANIAGNRGAFGFVAPGQSLKTDVNQFITERIEEGLEKAVEEQRRSVTLDSEIITIGGEEIDIEKYGWAGAGVWYNKIAQINGDLMTGVMNVPRARKYPHVMDYVYKEKLLEDANLSDDERYRIFHADGTPLNFRELASRDIANALNKVYEYWYSDQYTGNPVSSHTSLTGNAFIDAINMILGTNGLFQMCKNADIHPLAQLSMIGKGVMEAAIRNLGFSITGGIGSGASALLQFHQAVPGVLKAVSSFYGAVAGAGIIIGFILFYIVPFMPFLYFFFAVGGWVKGLFEAMVGVPLWALAHLRIDGEGLPGDAAAAGYFLVFEVFVRPILIVFGLLASVAIFSAMAKVLNEVFALVVSNMSGYDGSGTACGNQDGASDGSTPAVGSAAYFRGPVDEFFFTIIYAVIIYMLGMSSFKLIDMIPNNILRWMGRGEASFGDQAGEPAEGLVQKMSVGGYAVSGSMSGAAQSLGGAASGVAQGIGAASRERGSE